MLATNAVEVGLRVLSMATVPLTWPSTWHRSRDLGIMSDSTAGVKIVADSHTHTWGRVFVRNVREMSKPRTS